MKKKKELAFKIKVPYRLGLALHHWKIHFVVFAFMLLSFFYGFGSNNQSDKLRSYSPSLSAWYVEWVRNNQVIYLPIWNVHCKSCVKLAEKDSEKKTRGHNDERLVWKQLSARNKVFDRLETLHRKPSLSIVFDTSSKNKKYICTLTFYQATWLTYRERWFKWVTAIRINLIIFEFANLWLDALN